MICRIYELYASCLIRFYYLDCLRFIGLLIQVSWNSYDRGYNIGHIGGYYSKVRKRFFSKTFFSILNFKFHFNFTKKRNSTSISLRACSVELLLCSSLLLQCCLEHSTGSTNHAAGVTNHARSEKDHSKGSTTHRRSEIEVEFSPKWNFSTSRSGISGINSTYSISRMELKWNKWNNSTSIPLREVEFHLTSIMGSGIPLRGVELSEKIPLQCRP